MKRRTRGMLIKSIIFIFLHFLVTTVIYSQDEPINKENKLESLPDENSKEHVDDQKAIDKNINVNDNEKSDSEIQILSPVEKQSVNSGDILYIIWTVNNLTNENKDSQLKIEYSTNFGADWQSRSDDVVKASALVKEWKVPDVKTDIALIRFIDPAGKLKTSQSKRFEIKGLLNYYNISAGSNFNFVEGVSLTDLYAGIEVKIPSLFFMKNYGLYFYMAHGVSNSTDSNKFEINQLSQNNSREHLINRSFFSSLELNKSLNNSIKLNLLNFGYEYNFKKINFNQVTSVTSNRDTVIKNDTIHIDTTITREYSFNQTFEKHKIFLGTGITFDLNVDVFVPFNFYSSFNILYDFNASKNDPKRDNFFERFDYIARIYVRDLSIGIKIGMDLRGAFSESSEPSNLIVYIAKDISLGGLLKAN